MTELEALQLLIKKKELGITDDDVKAVMSSPIPSPTTTQEEKELIAQLSKTPFDDLTDEEITYYATPYFEELQERKKRSEETKTTDRSLKDG